MSSTKVINHFPLRPTLNFGLYERDDFILDKCATERSENHDEEKRRSRVAVVAIAHAACALFVERARAYERQGKIGRKRRLPFCGATMRATFKW